MIYPTETSIAYVMIQESILVEDRLQYMKDNTKTLSTDHDEFAKHQSTPDIVQHFADNADPTSNKSHTQYAVGLYRNKTIKQEDAPQLKEALTNFEKYKAKLKPEERQVNTKTYPRVSDLTDKIAPHMGTMASKKEAERTMEQPGHKLLHDDKDISIYHLTDKDASKAIYGGGASRGKTGTDWCTAARSEHNMFDNYSGGEKKVHVIHRKSDGAVFQMAPENNEFMDAKNNPISAEDFKSIAPALHAAWKKNPDLI